MDFKVLITDTALGDLREIVEYIAEGDRTAAELLGLRLVDQALSLRNLPLRFAFYDRLRGIRKMALPPYLIFYVCDEGAATVSILHFWRGARRSPPLFPLA